MGAHCVLSMLIEPSAYVVDGILVESSIQTLCAIRDMWCAEHIVQRAIWMIRRQRFDIKDVQSRTRPFRGHILTPGNHIHAECASDFCDLCADVAKPEDAESPAVEISSNRLLPTS